jgi:glycerate kinase
VTTWPTARAPARPVASGSPRWPFSGRRCDRGIDLVLDLVDFRAALPGAGLVVTGEGSLDEQTLHGKAPAGVAAAARAADVPVVAVAGRSLLDLTDLAATGISAAYALTDIEPDPARCMSEAGPLLERLAMRVAADWVTDDDEERAHESSSRA